MRLGRITTIGGCGVLLAGIAAGCVSWSIELPATTALVSRGLSESYGMTLSASGPTRVSLLPLPRIKFRDVRITAGDTDGPVLAEGGNLSVQLGLTALLAGRAEVVSLAFDHPRIVLPQDEDDTRWSGPVARLSQRLSGGDLVHPRRITLSGATISGRDPRDGRSEQARDVEAILSWPLWSDTLHLGARFSFHDRAARIALTGLRPGDLGGDGRSPFSASASWDAGSLNAEGTASLEDGLHLSGQANLTTRSLAETLGWLGADVALSPLVEEVALDGRFEASREGVHLPNLRARSGATVLDGAGSVELNGWRPSIRATLATDTLNLGPVLAGFLRIAGIDDPDTTETAGAGWGRRSLSLAPLVGGDLDLRLSAASARLGPVVLSDVAGSVIVREDGIDAALGRAGLQGGTLKGRLLLVQRAQDREGDTEVRAQGAFEKLDLAALLIDLGQYGWMLGATQGNFALDGKGRDADSLIRQVSGKANVAVEGGAIAGLDLSDVIHRGGAIAPGALARRNGRTPFERASVALAFADGIGLITEGGLASRALTASLRGRLSLPEKLFQARAELLPRMAAAGGDAAGIPATLFEISGPWDAVAVQTMARKSETGADPLTSSTAAIPGLPTRVRAYVP